MFNNIFEYYVLNEYKDMEGNLFVLEINMYKKYDILLVNIYGLNNDDLNFF